MCDGADIELMIDVLFSVAVSDDLDEGIPLLQEYIREDLSGGPDEHTSRVSQEAFVRIDGLVSDVVMEMRDFLRAEGLLWIRHSPYYRIVDDYYRLILHVETPNDANRG